MTLDVSFALAIPHTPWKTERRESLERLTDALEIGDGQPFLHHFRTFCDREANYVWSEKLWTWAAGSGCSHLLQLQDDAIVAPNFWTHLRAMVEANPLHVIGLEAAHPHGPNVEGCWYATTDMLIGVGYIVPIPALREFLEWRGKLRKGAVESLNEDQMLGLWCFVTERFIYHPVPTLIDHDTEIPSTYKNDDHQHRRPTVTWRDRPMPEWWTANRVPNFGRFYQATPKLARRWVPGVTEEDFAKWVST